MIQKNRMDCDRGLRCLMSASGLGTPTPYTYKNLGILLFFVEDIIGSLKSGRKPKSSQFLKCHPSFIMKFS